MPGPARLRGLERRLDPTRRHGLLQQRILARGLSRVGLQAGGPPVANISPTESTPDLQRKKLDLLRTLDQGVLGRMGRHDGLEAAIANYELAFRMQAAVPELMSLSGESAATERLYGLVDPYPPTQIFARECLIARRLVERGVRFIELLCPDVGADRWDQHGRPENRPPEQRPRRRPADRGPAHGPEGARLARVNPGRLGRRVRPHSHGPGIRRPRSQPLRLHHVVGRRRNQGRNDLRRRPMTTVITPSKTRSRSTTCTPRSFTCWAWTTSD